ncbi:MAG TPA: 2-dehydropantoate 2-reductase N-terminal domain-containing protein [Candidatus Acidoferrales bacterium]|nr:2-dehydropantoate 2-reductase N-terminal domain-containing protein [Candidatus Acidoferrales bacterium]
MKKKYRTLIMGASYGSLLGTKLALAGHDVTLVCLPPEVEAINRDGVRVRMPVKGKDQQVEVDSRTLPGKIVAVGPSSVKPGDYDLIALAMQEPQYRTPGPRELLDAVALSRVPTMSIMNMPPLTYVKRIPGLDYKPLEAAYTDASVWQNFDTDVFTLCSPDPQAFRPPDEPPNVLQVTLPTNFKAARFASDEHTQILRDMQEDVENARYGDEKLELPVKLKVHDSIFVPLAKWAMLITGNYRCVQPDEARSIRDAVHADADASRQTYDWVRELCISLGASPGDLVPFEKYAAAALGLPRPSSAARALFAGAPNIERVDRLVQSIAAQKGMHLPVLDQTVKMVDDRLAKNREAALAKA